VADVGAAAGAFAFVNFHERGTAESVDELREDFAGFGFALLGRHGIGILRRRGSGPQRAGHGHGQRREQDQL
jgi:hypothetical protein